MELKIRRLRENEVSDALRVINDAARAYKRILSSHVYKEPQMALREFLDEAERIGFYVVEDEARIIGVMGYEYVEDVVLIRHAYVKPGRQRKGVGSLLLRHLEDLIRSENRASRIVVGTYADAYWAVDFYRKHGYKPVSDHDATLRRYYVIPDIQRENSIALEKEIERSSRG